MSVEDYVNAAERVGRELNTIQVELSSSLYRAIESTLRDEDNLIDYRLLNGAEKRAELENGIVGFLENAIRGRYNMSEEQYGALDDFRKAELMMGRYGVSGAYINNVIENLRGRFTPDAYMNKLEDAVRMVTANLSAIPMSKLTQADAQAVVDYVGANPDNPRNPNVKIDADALHVPDMDYLLRKFITRGVVTERDIEGRNYRIE